MNREDERIALEELRRGEGHRFDDPAEAVRWLSTDFYEEDEPVGDVLAAFDAATDRGKTTAPMTE